MLTDLPFLIQKIIFMNTVRITWYLKKILRPEFFLNLKNKVINYITLSTKCRFWGEKYPPPKKKKFLLIMKRKLCFEKRSLFFWVTEIREIIGFRVSFVRKLKNQFIWNKQQKEASFHYAASVIIKYFFSVYLNLNK